MNEEKAGSPHLGDEGTGLEWDWWGENPVEIILVTFILVLFFTLPRMGCGIGKSKAPTGALDGEPEEGTERNVGV